MESSSGTENDGVLRKGISAGLVFRLMPQGMTKKMSHKVLGEKVSKGDRRWPPHGCSWRRTTTSGAEGQGHAQMPRWVGPRGPQRHELVLKALKTPGGWSRGGMCPGAL